MPIEKNRKNATSRGVADSFALSADTMARGGVLKKGMNWGRAIALASSSFGFAAAACGARTALIAESSDAMPIDAAIDVRRDAPRDVVVPLDSLPPIDATGDHTVPLDCPDASDTRVYLFTEQNELYSFYPPNLAYKKIGNIACPNATGNPYSMGVDRNGVAYALFDSGQVFRLSTSTAACSATSYVPNQLGWTTFGMGYASTPDGGEALYVTEANFNTPSKGLGRIDTMSFKLGFINPFSATLPRCELTGTGDGRLFAFCLNMGSNGAVLAQIAPTNAAVVGADNLAVGDPSNGFAFAFWGGDFWIFTSTTSDTTVTKYDPLTKGLNTVTMLTGTVVGARGSPCAPP